MKSLGSSDVHSETILDPLAMSMRAGTLVNRSGLQQNQLYMIHGGNKLESSTGNRTGSRPYNLLNVRGVHIPTSGWMNCSVMYRAGIYLMHWFNKCIQMNTAVNGKVLLNNPLLTCGYCAWLGLERNYQTAVSHDEMVDFPRVLIDGPYGAPTQDFDNFETVLLIGAGVGVTPFISVMREMLHKFHQNRCPNCQTVCCKCSLYNRKLLFVSVFVYLQWLLRSSDIQYSRARSGKDLLPLASP